MVKKAEVIHTVFDNWIQRALVKVILLSYKLIQQLTATRVSLSSCFFYGKLVAMETGENLELFFGSETWTRSLLGSGHQHF